ncbi:MAG TPA: CinA family protein, partial [Burkholderiales bacterium]
MDIAIVAGDLLKRRNETIAVAESSAGGLINAALVAVPGASAYYRGGGLIYTAKARAALLRSEERRVGKECAKVCSSRWW